MRWIFTRSIGKPLVAVMLVAAAALVAWMMSEDPDHQRAARVGVEAQRFVARVSGFHEREHRYPSEAEAQALLVSRQGNRETMEWRAADKAIVVTFNDGKLRGSRLVIESRVDGGALQWRCRYDMPERFGRRVCGPD